jgi:hypothetical protein
VLQLVFRFISIMVVNGYLTTSLMKLSPEDFQTEDSYTSVKKSMANNNTLNDYIKDMAKTFEIPDCLFQEPSNGLAEGQVEDEGPGHIEFADLPSSHHINAVDIKKFKTVIESKQKLCKVFNTGIAKK